MWTIPNPRFCCPVQMFPNIIGHVGINGSRSTLLCGKRLASWSNTRQSGYFINHGLRALGQQIFVLRDPDVCYSLIVLDSHEIPNLICSHFHNIGIGFSTTVISHFIKGLMIGVFLYGVFRFWNGNHWTTNEIFPLKVFLTRFCLIRPAIRSDAFHRPGFCQEGFPLIVISIL